MKKMVSLIKACMTDNMSLFRVKSKSKSKVSKTLLPIFLTIVVMFTIGGYAESIIILLKEVNAEFVVLTIFGIVTTILTLVEGIYKSSNLLFNCKDDNLLLSLPIKKSTVLFIRVLKFYVFEIMYNSLFLAPAIIVYAYNVDVSPSYYLVSIIGLLILPIVPIIISCILGLLISFASTKFKYKNFVQIVITMAILLVVMSVSFNSQKLVTDLTNNALNINNNISKFYYPVGAYIKLVNNFNLIELIVFLLIHAVLFFGFVKLFSNIYFNINSNTKSKRSSSNKKYIIKTRKPIKSLINKELKRFISSPVFVINAAFGLVLFIVLCIIYSINFNTILESLSGGDEMIPGYIIEQYTPIILFGFICFSALMSSISSSMISLEGKSFSMLKSLPIKPFTIINSKVLAAVFLMIPTFIIGDIILFVRFKFNIQEILMILVLSILVPFVAETIGIIINLKYPKMDAENDTQVVKQSMSSAISVFLGILLSGATLVALVGLISSGKSIDETMFFVLLGYIIIYSLLLIYMKLKSVKLFNDIEA